MNSYLLATWLGFGDADASRAEETAGALLSGVRELAGFGPAAVYRLVSGGETMSELARRVARLDLDPGLGAAQYVVLLQLERVAAALGPNGARAAVRHKVVDGLAASVSYQALFIESEHTVGAEPLEDDFGKAIQFGTFSMRDDESEWGVADWYESLRLPTITDMPGVHRARRLFSVCGVPKYGILYEFASLDMRREHFESAHERYALDTSHPTGQIVTQTIHSPMSPSVAERIAP